MKSPSITNLLPPRGPVSAFPGASDTGVVLGTTAGASAGVATAGMPTVTDGRIVSAGDIPQPPALSRVRDAIGTAVGVAAQGVNELMQKAMPSPLRDADLIVIQGTGAVARGAAMVRDRFTPSPTPIDYTALREQRPLLAAVNATVKQTGHPVVLSFAASSPNVDFSKAGRESAMVSLYVDGSYHSDVAVLAERNSGAYRVNVGELTPGRHRLELRAATDVSGAEAAPAQVKHARVELLDGIAAAIARFAPVIETRHERQLPVGAPPLAATGDLPLLLTSSVSALPDGRQRIDYDMMFSNEDGGTPITKTFRNFGRATDYEPVYSVTVDELGNRVTDSFQGPSHVPYRFRGAFQGDRPVLRVSTRNNLFDSRLLGATPLWSEAPQAPTPTKLTDRELMLKHPWTFTVMGKEMLREGKVAPSGVAAAAGGSQQVVDARRHLYFEPQDDARLGLEKYRKVTLQLRDGHTVDVLARRKSIMPTMPNRPALGTAIPLPDGVNPEDVVGVHHLEGRVFVLDDAFQPRQLATV